MRKLFVYQIVILALGAATLGCTVPDPDPAPDYRIATTSGVVSPEPGPEDSLGYKDIPFAEPPEGAGRWAAPSPLTSPERVITTRSDPVMCPQPQSMASGGAEGDYLGSEDCLYLDIYAPPRAADSASAPVMLWIHGGSNLTEIGRAHV